ncbi:MAG TPA: ROK family protein [Thermomicrobiales bacterium]|nr:ROK family protein [Thermomicrobiales bacterium]
MASDERLSDQAFAIGVEIGGRGQRVVIATRDGHIIESVAAIGHQSTASGTVETVCDLVEQVISKRHIPWKLIIGIGIAFGGPVDSHRGVTIRSHRMPGFEQLPLVGVFEDRFGARTVLENDARAAALGEFTSGAGRGARDMVYFHLGVGVGGGIVLGGVLQHGASMTSGEIGHMVVSADGHDGPRCSCGKPGHLEAYASESAIIARMRDRLAIAAPEATARWLASPGVSVARIFETASEDEDARAVVNETIQVIGLAAANLVTALNPDAVVVGGSVAEAGTALTSGIRAKIRQYAFDAAARRVTVASAQLGADAPLIGAVVLARSPDR